MEVLCVFVCVCVRVGGRTGHTTLMEVLRCVRVYVCVLSKTFFFSLQAVCLLL